MKMCKFCDGRVPTSGNLLCIDCLDWWLASELDGTLINLTADYNVRFIIMTQRSNV